MKCASAPSETDRNAPPKPTTRFDERMGPGLNSILVCAQATSEQSKAPTKARRNHFFTGRRVHRQVTTALRRRIRQQTGHALPGWCPECQHIDCSSHRLETRRFLRWVRRQRCKTSSQLPTGQDRFLRNILVKMLFRKLIWWVVLAQLLSTAF